jgi:hypothetical protein
MTLLDQSYHRDNLERAWRWLKSNPAASYKNYFRAAYNNFAVADTALLENLRDRLKRDVYEPAHACKVNFPKASGGLRQYSLLTVEDQVVYQAFANVIAERLTPQIRHRHGTEVFSYIYAGRSSPWFYRRWTDWYGQFVRTAREAFANGLRFTAQFDLTAFYDSIDHRVLRHFLMEFGCDRDFCSRLLRCLEHWTATGKRIYQGHGIPQGPLSSGLMAEVVLQHFDGGRPGRPHVRYLRYVDDIRLFAASLDELKRAVLELDLLSKDVGLFPQSAKIRMHKVEDIEAELKTISSPDDFEMSDEIAENQPLVHKRLTQLSPSLRVADITRFKYLLGRASPRAATNRRLWRVLDNHPDLYGAILRYFQKYVRLPAKAAAELVARLRAPPLYAALIAEIVRTAEDRTPPEFLEALDVCVKKGWRPQLVRAADLLAALGKWGIKRGVLDSGRILRAVRKLPEWWTRAELVAALDSRFLPQPHLNELLLEKLSDDVSDVAIAAAVHLGLQGTKVPDGTPMQSAAAQVLAEFGLTDAGVARVCAVQRSFERLLGPTLPKVDWRGLFGRRYGRAERQAVLCYAYAAADATAWVNAMDVFNDLLLVALASRDPTHVKHTLGNFGSVLPAGSGLALHYPALYRLVHCVHGKRGESALSHVVKRKGGVVMKPTARIPFRFLGQGKKLLRGAVAELARCFPVHP